MIRLVATVVLGCLFCAGTVSAQEQPGVTSPSEQDKQKAVDLLNKGNRYYDVGEYERALEVYGEGYATTNAPGFLFSIAQAHRLKGNCVAARAYYLKFLKAVPATTKREVVEGLLKRVESCADESSVAPETTGDVGEAAQPLPAAPEPAAGTTTSAEGAPRTGLKVIGIATAVSGLAMLGFGGHYAWDARSKSQELSDFGGTWGPEQIETERRGARAESRGIVLLAAGGAALIGGTVIYVLAGRNRETSPGAVAVQPSPTRGGGLVSVVGSF